MKFCKVLDVKTPTRGTSGSAGLDFYIPEDTKEFKAKFNDKNEEASYTNIGLTIRPHSRINIPSGIKVNIPKGHALIAFNKSGVSLRYGLDVGACVIDEDYQGELHISLVNTTRETIFLRFGEKIVQFILLPVEYPELEEVSEDECFEENSERGSGGYGSTGIQ